MLLSPDNKEINLQVYTPIAKILGGVAVVAALVFLVVEARETQEINARAVQEGIESLDEAERDQYMTRRIALWDEFESAYFARKQGVLADSEWSRFNDLMCQYFALEPEAWEGITAREGIAYSLTAEFRLYTEISCS